MSTISIEEEKRRRKLGFNLKSKVQAEIEFDGGRITAHVMPIYLVGSAKWEITLETITDTDKFYSQYFTVETARRTHELLGKILEMIDSNKIELPWKDEL